MEGVFSRHCRQPGATDVNSNSSQAQQRAEKLFKKRERAQDARQAMSEYETHALAVREKTVRLRALRLAKERLS
jgi:L-serine deaminase